MGGAERPGRTRSARATAAHAAELDRFRGALTGLAVGDAVGTTVEFARPGSFPPVTDMVGGGPFGLPAGAWTDDTSMALCLAESLVGRRGFDPADQLARYVRWYREGHLSSTGRCFDIGGATRAALHRFERTGEPFPGDADPHAAGNGPLMKLAPVALAHALHPEVAVRRAAECARTTHGAPQAVDAARYFAGLLVGALGGADIDRLIRRGPYEPRAGLWAEEPLHPEVAAVAAGSFRAKDPPEIRGEGYVVRSLEAALWALDRSGSFEEGVLRAVNLGDDADTTAAIVGQLAGAIHGAEAIPARWRGRVVGRDLMRDLADDLHALAHEIEPMVPVSPAGRWAMDDPAPTPAAPCDAYWVFPGRLLAGAYPGDLDDAAAAEKIDSLRAAGVTHVIDLTEEGESGRGGPLRPYEPLLGEGTEAGGRRITRRRLPIRDVSVPAPERMREILDGIRSAIDDGETVYVHCWGGVGRTGTVIGCLLIEEGVPPDEVLGRIAELRRHTARASRTAPEMPEQRSFVRTWEPRSAEPGRAG